MRQRRPRPGSDNGIKCRSAEPGAPQAGLDSLRNVPLRNARAKVGKHADRDRRKPLRRLPAASPISHASFTIRQASTAVIVGISESAEPPAFQRVVSQFGAHGHGPCLEADRPAFACNQPDDRLVVGVVNERLSRSARRLPAAISSAASRYRASVTRTMSCGRTSATAADPSNPVSHVTFGSVVTSRRSTPSGASTSRRRVCRGARISGGGCTITAATPTGAAAGRPRRQRGSARDGPRLHRGVASSWICEAGAGA